MVRCQNCKAENNEKDVYCAQCGFPLHEFPESKTVIGSTNEAYSRPSPNELPLAPPPPSTPHGTSNGFFDYHQSINEYNNVYQQGENKTSSAYTTLWGGTGPEGPWNNNTMAAQEKPRRKRSLLEYILSSIFGIWGTLCAGFGLYGFLEGINPKDNSLQNRAVALGLLYMLLGIIFVIVVLIRHKYPRLRWWRGLVGHGGAFIVGVLIIIIGAIYLAITTGSSDFENYPLFDFIMGFAFMCYGIGSTFFALW